MVMRNVKIAVVCLIAVTAWSLLVAYAAFYGWWMSPVAAQGNTDEFYAWAVREIESSNQGNSALILMQEGEVVRQFYADSQDGVDEHTLFPTASFSKWITAISVMSLVESEQLDLDAPVSHYLTRWQLPDSEFNNDKV